MRGPKLNEGASAATLATGERHGTKATAKYVRSSAYKARVVLDLIRGLDVKRADEVLQFTERAIAHDVRKVLASAVANATDLDNAAYIADADELFVLACFADEGPTLRRFRPRARGRATRIRKRTCHITIVVARMSEQRLEIVHARAEGASAGASANRRARVERSRKRAAAAKAQAGATADETIDETADDLGDETADDVVATPDDVAGFADTEAEADAIEADAIEADAIEADVDDADDIEAGADDAAADDQVDGAARDEAGTAQFEPGEYPGSVRSDAEGDGPDTHPIKGNADSMLYHTPDSRYYAVTKAEVWFDSEASAEAAGFSKPGTQATNDQDED